MPPIIQLFELLALARGLATEANGCSEELCALLEKCVTKAQLDIDQFQTLKEQTRSR